jgi:hypothetical protein
VNLIALIATAEGRQRGEPVVPGQIIVGCALGLLEEVQLLVRFARLNRA